MGLRILVVLFLIGATFWPHVSDRYKFWLLHLHRREGDITLPLKKKLMTRRGVLRLAMDDINVWGGSNRGASSWMLIYSPLDEFVESGLTELAESPDTDRLQRMEAWWILWQRTGRKEHLKGFFDEARKPGRHMRRTRLRLAIMLDSEDTGPLGAPEDSPVDMTFDEFLEAFKRYEKRGGYVQRPLVE
jgi:hypothetical protein